MPRSSRHKSSHKSQRRSSPVDWSGSDEERASEARVSKDSESEKRKSSHSKDTKESNNGYATADHGKKRKERIESKDESGASDRWDSGLGKDGDGDVLVEKRSNADGYNTVDVEKERDKEKYVKEESKSRSSRRHEERSEEKRRYKEEKDREREKEKAREKEKDKEREKEKDSDRDRDREREKDRDRDRERSSRREKYEEDKREKERYEGDRRDKEANEEEKREKERHLEDKRDKHRHEEVKREKERYDEDKREKVRHDGNVASRKRESETTQIEEVNSANKDVDIINETDPIDRELREKHSKRRWDEISPEEKDKDREKERDRERDREKEKEKEKHRDDHSKNRSSKEYKSEPDKYKDKHRDRDRDRDRDDRREKEYYEYKSSREGNRSSESRYKKSKGSEADPYDIRDEYVSKHKDGHGSKRSYEATEDRHERDVEKEDVEKSRGEYRYGDKEKEKEKEKVDSSPGKMRPKNSPGSISHHDREQNRHRSKPAESPKKEVMQEDRSRARTSSTGERTPSRLRDEKLSRPRDDAHSLELSSEIASSTPRSDTHASPKFAPEKSPSNTSLKYSSSRGGSGSSKYRDRDRDRDRERDSDVPTSDKLMTLKREPTPVGTFNRSNSSGSYPPLPYEDGDNRRDSGPDRRFHKRGGHAHGNNNWNGAPNWASQVNNGFMPLPPGPPPPSGFHHFGGPPPLFGIRPPPLKLGPPGVGVPFPMHDPMDRFSGPMRGPYGWHNGGNNPLEDSFPPNLWGPAGNGVFGTEPFWDQNRHLPSWKAQGELLNKELINVSQKGIGATAPASKVEEQSINENLPSESVDIQVEIVKGGSSVETSIKDQELQKLAPEVDNRQEANRQETTVKVVSFWESCIPRAAISRNLVDLELLKKCNSAAVGELEKLNGASDKSQADLIRKEKRNGTSIIVLKSLFPRSKDENFQKAMSLYNKLSNRQTPLKTNDLLGAPDLEESEVHNQSDETNVQVEVPVTDNVPLMDVKPDLGNNDVEVDKKVSSNLVSDCDSVIFKSEPCDQVMKESSEDGLSRIPISTENTH